MRSVANMSIATPLACLHETTAFRAVAAVDIHRAIID